MKHPAPSPAPEAAADAAAYAAFDHLATMVAVVSPEGRCVFANASFENVLGLSRRSVQRGPLWWAAHHRDHHKYSDTPQDVHSPVQTSFGYSHVGWIFSRDHHVFDDSTIPDLTKFPELRWLHRFELAPAILLAGLCFLIDGWAGLFVGFFWSTVAVYHATFCINSLAHVHGDKDYVTGDESRNNWWLAIITMGEGWHNNHHHFMASARQGFRWWEIDLSYYILRGLAAVGLVWDLKEPPPHLLR